MESVQKPKRLFIAVDPSAEVLAGVEESAEELKARADAFGFRISWIPPRNYHITLKFLGSVGAEIESKLEEMIETACAEIPPFEIELSGLGCFPSAGRSRVLWAGVKDLSLAFTKLVPRLEEGSEALGFAHEDRTFHPHLTLGKLRDPKNLTELIRSPAPLTFGRSEIREVVLYESRLKAGGSEYTALQRFALRP